MSFRFPTTQRQLLELARGDKTKRDFADDLEVDRTAWGRYETEKMRVPPRLMNILLKLVHDRLIQGTPEDPKLAAMQFAKATLREIARIDGAKAENRHPVPMAAAAEVTKSKRRQKSASRRNSGAANRPKTASAVTVKGRIGKIGSR